MLKKVALAVAGVLLLGTIGVIVWARSVLGTDTVRTALASQIAQRIGQPVTIGGISATVYPRVSITLDQVAIGKAGEITVARLDVGTDFRALLSRKVEHAALHLDGAKVSLPLPPLMLGSTEPSPPAAASGSPVEIVSIDEVVLKNIEIVSGGRTLKGDIDLVPQGPGVLVRNVVLTAGDASVTAHGNISDLAGPVGDLTIRSGALNIDNLIAFANSFTAGAGTIPGTGADASAAASAAPASASPAAPQMRITLDVQADRASMGGLAIEKVAGKAVVGGDRFAMDPVSFGLFGGTYQGALTVSLHEAAPTFHWTAQIANIDVAAATAFAGSPNLVSGRLGGTVDLSGSGQDAATAMKTVHGTTRIDVTNGIVRNLGLVRAVTAATALSVQGLQQAAASRQNADEPFSRLGATIRLANGVASTEDLKFEAADLTLTTAGTVTLASLGLDLKGRVQLSEALSKQSNATLVSLTGDQGRITLPATIGGTASQPSIRIDAGDMAKRAIRNAAAEQGQKLLNQQTDKLLKDNPEAKKLIGGKIGGLFGGKK